MAAATRDDVGIVLNRRPESRHVGSRPGLGAARTALAFSAGLVVAGATVSRLIKDNRGVAEVRHDRVDVVLDRADRRLPDVATEGERPQGATPRDNALTAQSVGNVFAFIAALLVAGAGLIHFAFAPSHLREYAPFGVSFYVMGAVQLVMAAGLALGIRSRRFLAFAAVANVSLCLLWAVTRSVGLPIGPEHWKAEAVGLGDLTCVGFQVLAACLLWSMVSKHASVQRLANRRLSPAAALAFVVVFGVLAAPLAARAARATEGDDSAGMTTRAVPPATPEPADGRPMSPSS